jgi:FKBP-type peptidyl-prolyl cis-trans isomerase
MQRAQHAAACCCRAQQGVRTPNKVTVVQNTKKNRRQFLSSSASSSSVALFLFLATTTTTTSFPPNAEASDEEKGVSENGLLLVNYVGKLKDGTVFDTTYGGEIVSTSENSVSVRESETQPVVINLAANAVQPGQVKGLKRGLIGAKRGETREIMVKAEDGFGSSSVVSPLRVRVPAESELFYTVEVLRVSNTGVDDLFKGVSLCSVGVANKTTAGCSDLSDNKK